MARILTSGIGETVGDSLATGAPLYLSGQVWYCDYVNGVDAVSPRGLTREQPLQTITQALTNCADGDVIVMLAMEVRSVRALINKKVTIIGVGNTLGIPGSGFTQANATQGGVQVVSTSGVGTVFRNIRFASSTVATTGDKCEVNASDVRFIGCWFDGGANDGAAMVSLGANAHRVTFRNTFFVGQGTSLAARPASVIDCANALEDIRFDGCTVTNGQYGFSEPYAIEFSAAQTRFEFIASSLLLGADLKLNSSSTCIIQPGTMSGGARIEF
jgi:hypothetical protein